MKLQLTACSAATRRQRPGAACAAGAALTVAAGEQVAVIGPSGAGKTTLLQVLACAMPPTPALAAGWPGPLGLPRSALQRLRGQLFLAPQVPPLPPRQRVVTAVLAGRLPRMGCGQLALAVLPTDIRRPMRRWHFDLADKLFERVDRLSGGERQRVGLARALVSPPTVAGGRTAVGAGPHACARPWPGSRRRTRAKAPRWWPRCTMWTWPGHFPRVVGCAMAKLAFDLPAAQVTPETCTSCTTSTTTSWRTARPPPMCPWRPHPPAHALPLTHGPSVAMTAHVACSAPRAKPPATARPGLAAAACSGWWLLLCCGRCWCHRVQALAAAGARCLKPTLQFLADFVPPRLDAEFLALVARETWRTVAIATAGLTLALVLAVPLALLSVRVLSISALTGPMAPLPALVRLLVRWLLVVLRSVPELIWALVLCAWWAWGPRPACWPLR
jgi:phosphonate transport system ATP-binding protein